MKRLTVGKMAVEWGHTALRIVTTRAILSDLFEWPDQKSNQDGESNEEEYLGTITTLQPVAICP